MIQTQTGRSDWMGDPRRKRNQNSSRPLKKRNRNLIQVRKNINILLYVHNSSLISSHRFGHQRYNCEYPFFRRDKTDAIFPTFLYDFVLVNDFELK